MRRVGDEDAADGRLRASTLRWHMGGIGELVGPGVGDDGGIVLTYFGVQ